MSHYFNCLPLAKLNRPLTFVSGGVQTVGLLTAGLSAAVHAPGTFLPRFRFLAALGQTENPAEPVS